jgi:uncharacterized protein YmfQ (DUF2313 family)
MKTNFKPNTLETNTQVLANYLPTGILYTAKNIGESKLRKMLKALAHELTREQDKLYELSYEHKLDTTTNLIQEWERALGIPDDCFNTNQPIEIRRKQIVAKFAKMNLLTEQDWIDLAKLFGYDIRIIHPIEDSGFDYDLDFFFYTDKEARFVMIIEFLHMYAPEDVFDCTFDFTFSDDTNVVICLFEHLKPANVKLIFEYELTPDIFFEDCPYCIV